MKNFSLLFCLFILFMSCDKDDSEYANSKNLITENVTIFIDESELDNCLYSILTKDNNSYTTDNLPGEYSEIKFEARLKYQLTDERKNCGFSGPLKRIKIIELVKI
ncbi:hypothetical protein SAMN05444483_103333 [Salegentibacter echinorum]|uniref:Uncharacterized protein n=1 Tax=Salegentibacter echinorum TaxID=1073325 RepID=A0A1M5FT13_SALEC|nr:hypothetical protein [Salegentibacter echinorum]SHF94549.1 hypothetical protein SAMN05444483_103333 [Salegentibacter echinorum]